MERPELGAGGGASEQREKGGGRGERERAREPEWTPRHVRVDVLELDPEDGGDRHRQHLASGYGGGFFARRVAVLLLPTSTTAGGTTHHAGDAPQRGPHHQRAEDHDRRQIERLSKQVRLEHVACASRRPISGELGRSRTIPARREEGLPASACAAPGTRNATSTYTRGVGLA